jgi:hypothetical protein
VQPKAGKSLRDIVKETGLARDADGTDYGKADGTAIPPIASLCAGAMGGDGGASRAR